MLPCRGHAAGFDAEHLTSWSSRNGWNRPIAFEPPPIAATSISGSARALEHLGAGFLADHALEIADHLGIGMRTGRRADACRMCRRTLVTQSRSASFIASFSVAAPEVTGARLRAEQFHAEQLGACRATSVAPMKTSQGRPKRRRRSRSRRHADPRRSRR